MQNNFKIDPKKLDIINQAIHEHMEPLYVWGCDPVDDDQGRGVKIVPLENLHHAPSIWMHRQIAELGMKQLIDEVIALHGS